MNSTQGYYLAVLGMLLAYFGLGWTLAGVVIATLDVWDIVITVIACLWGHTFYVIGRDAVRFQFEVERFRNGIMPRAKL